MSLEEFHKSLSCTHLCTLFAMMEGFSKTTVFPFFYVPNTTLTFGETMKKLIAAIVVLVSTITFAGSTGVVWVRGETENEVEREMRMKVQEINRKRSMRIGGRNCSNPKVYAASAPKKSFRVNRFGELEVQWTATIKVSCSNDD